MKYEYGIVGGGPAGYTAGCLLAKQGHSVILFEQNKLGGTCLNKGCIPTKALLHVSELYRNTKTASCIGLDLEIKNFDFSKIVEYKNNVIEKIRKQLELVVKNSGVNVIYSKAIIENSNMIIANGVEYEVDKIINAVGSIPCELKGLEFDHNFILNSDDILNLQQLPKSILIVGSGAIGIEWARIFSNFGVEVNIVELAEHLIPNADIDISKRIERIFRQNKIKYYLNNKISTIKDKVVTLQNGEILEPEIILVAVGRKPLEKFERCSNIGDVCNEIQLAHYAIHQAKEFSLDICFNKDFVPAVIYGTPEIAWVGKREQDCSGDIEKILYPISALGKSWCDSSTEGFIKLLVNDKKIIGAHIISPEASSLIQTLTVVMQNDMTIDQLKEICYPHPTYTEGIFEAIMRL